MGWTVLPKAILTVATVWVSACSPEMSADASTTKAMAPDTASPAVPGAWGTIDAFSPDVQEAARFAVQTFAVQNKQRVLYKDVTQARLQVVAGLQFELQLQVTWDGTPRTAQARVWRQLNGVYRLQSWDWLD
jgi:hypothetical protein